jgi:hypothetical protein
MAVSPQSLEGLPETPARMSLDQRVQGRDNVGIAIGR